jgi:hypothetical protein
MVSVSHSLQLFKFHLEKTYKAQHSHPQRHNVRYQQCGRCLKLTENYTTDKTDGIIGETSTSSGFLSFQKGKYNTLGNIIITSEMADNRSTLCLSSPHLLDPLLPRRASLQGNNLQGV